MKSPVTRWLPFGTEKSASARLRAFIPAAVLRSKGWDADVFSEADYAKTDVVVFQKRYTTEDLELANRLKQSGKKVVFDLCDNHSYNPDNSEAIAERTVRLNQMFALADAVTLSSKELGKYVDHKNVSFIDDATEPSDRNPLKQLYYNLFRSTNTPGKKSIVWFGASGSTSPPFGLIDLGKIIPVLNKVNEKEPIRLNVFSDSREEFKKYTSGATFEAVYYPWQKASFPYFFSQHALCVLPISRNAFTDCKTSNRIILALQLKVPVITERIPSYEDFDEFLFYNDWEKNITDILSGSNKDLVKSKLKNGLAYVNAHYNDQHVYKQWSDFLSRFAH